MDKNSPRSGEVLSFWLCVIKLKIEVVFNRNLYRIRVI